MPIYEYACTSCGHHLEALQKLSDAKLTDCPECGKPDLQKQISAAGFRLKGSGWYETDFKNSKKDGAPKKQDKQDKKPDKPSKQTESCGAGACAACTD